MTIKLSELTKKIVKEEVTKILTEAEATKEHDFFKPFIDQTTRKLRMIRPKGGVSVKGADGKVDQIATMKKGYEDFAKWAMSKFPNKFPEKIRNSGNPMDALDWMNKHPEGPGMTPFQLRKMWENIPSINAGMGKIEKFLAKEKDPSLGSTEDEVNDSDEESELENGSSIEDLQKASKEVRGKYQTGDVNLKDIGAELGDITPTAVNQMQDKALAKIKPFGSPEADNDVFERGFEVDDEAWEDAKIDAVDKYVQLLQASGGDWDAFYSALKSQNLIAKSDIDILKAKEIPALETIMDYIREGETGVAEEIILTDLEDAVKENKPIVLRSFQNVLSAVFNPPAKKGRPAGAKGKAKAKEEDDDISF